MKTVILGTAHGVNVAGKQSPDGRLQEYKYSREMCRMVRDRLTALGINCVIDIEDDTEPSLMQRVALVNRLVARHGDCIYVSIHNNAAGSDGKWHDARGFAVFVSPNASSGSKQLASIIHTYAMAMGMKGNRCHPATGYHVMNLAVCRATHCPAVLTENLFQDNRDDVDYLLSPQGKQAITQLHVKSIVEYLKNHTS